jgi:hypothetical protein
MRTKSLYVTVVSKNANCSVVINDKSVKVLSEINGVERSYDSNIAFNYVSELRDGMFDIRSIVSKLNEIFGVDLEINNDVFHFFYDSDDLYCKLFISKGIKRYELIHK